MESPSFETLNSLAQITRGEGYLCRDKEVPASRLAACIARDGCAGVNVPKQIIELETDKK